MGETKKCKNCGQEKPLDDFYRSSVYKDGHRAICKQCDFEKNRQYRLAHGMKPRSESAKAIAEREGIKKCIVCGRTLPIADFSSHSSRCRECRRKYKEEKRREKGIVPRDYIQQEARRTGSIVCSVCGEKKLLADYDKNGSVYRTQCRACRKKYLRKWYKDNKDTKIADYLEKNSEKIRVRNKEYYDSHREAIIKYSRKWHRENRDRALLASKQWRDAHPEYRKRYMAEWRKKNEDYRREYKREYRRKNAAAIREYTQERRNYLYKTDPLYKLKVSGRNLILKSFKRKGFSKNSHTAKILGCSWEQLQGHLLATWKRNYGSEWSGEPYHIDHVIPLATATTEDEVIRLCHYTNLQMLTPEDNISKNDNLDWSLEKPNTDD